MKNQHVAVVTQWKKDGRLNQLKVFPSHHEFISEYGSFANDRELSLMGVVLDGSQEHVLGMLDLQHRSWERIYYMVGSDAKSTQDALRLAVYERGEHTRFVEKD